MQSEYPVQSLGNLVKLRSGYSFKSADWVDSGCPVIKITNVKSGRINRDGCAYVTNHVAEKAAEWWTRDGDVLIAMTGYVGEVARVKKGERYLINQRVGRFDFKDRSILDPEYFFYLAQHPEFRAEIEGLARGSAQPNLSAKDIEGVQVPLPALAVQKVIAGALSSLDNRIDLAWESNKALESLSKAIFKSWYIDFDPVRAKSEGREPEGMSADVAALFPSEFVDSELGPIPKGWQVRAIGDVVECVGGGTPSTKEPAYWDGGTHNWASPKDLSSAASPILLNTAGKLTDAGLGKVSSGLLPAGTVLMSSRAPIGYLAITGMPTAINQGFIAMKASGPLPNSYLYLWAQANMEEIKSRANGSTFMEISKAAFRPIPAVIPSQAVIDAFHQLAGPMFFRIESGARVAASLRDIRDLLLPRLLSGRECVSNDI